MGLRVSTDGSSRWSRCLTHLEHIVTNLDNDDINNSLFKFSINWPHVGL